MGWYSLVLYFAVYSLIGWVCETVSESYLARRFINRGFLNGPFCPVYGFGAFAVLWATRGLPRNAVLIFIVSAVVTTALEYFTGWLLETLFQAKWWDYSHMKYNIHGRVCLLNTVLFGLMCVALVFFLHPFFARETALLPPAAGKWAAAGLLCYFAADFAVSVATVLRLNRRLRRISELAAAVREKLDAYGWYDSINLRERIDRFFETVSEGDHPIYQSLLGIRERFAGLAEDNRLLQRRIIRAFPHFRSVAYPEALTYLRELIVSAAKKAPRRRR